MKQILPILLFFIGVNLHGQEVNTPSVGTSYANQTFYNLNDGSTKSNPHTDWDIAFDVSQQGAGVLVNEGVGLSFTAPMPEVVLYYNGATDFVAADTTGMTRIFNEEIEWTTGAFNSIASGNPADMGWGDYDFMTHAINGTKVFFIKLRNDNYKKLEIQSLIQGVYTFRYADLDGANEMTQTIDKSNYAGKTLAYFSIENETALDLEPANWDLLFTRYYTPLDDGQGGILDYSVTGVLQNSSVEVAQADNITPATVDYNNYLNSMSDSLTIIGHDWKYYAGSWNIETNRVYFVKTATDSIYKLEFFDFAGSFSGVTTLEKTFETVLTSTNNLYSNVSSFEVFPNPVVDHTNIAFESNINTNNATVRIFNLSGQTVFQESMSVQNGLNIKRLNLNLTTGQYILTVQIENELLTNKLFMQ